MCIVHVWMVCMMDGVHVCVCVRMYVCVIVLRHLIQSVALTYLTKCSANLNNTFVDINKHAKSRNTIEQDIRLDKRPSALFYQRSIVDLFRFVLLQIPNGNQSSVVTNQNLKSKWYLTDGNY